MSLICFRESAQGSEIVEPICRTKEQDLEWEWRYVVIGGFAGFVTSSFYGTGFFVAEQPAEETALHLVRRLEMSRFRSREVEGFLVTRGY